MKYKVILDTDTFNEADDQFAISYLMKSLDVFDIEAITIAPFKHEKYTKTVSDSIDDSYNEACKIFDLLNINNKSMIYKGSRNYLSNGYVESNDAVNKIIDVALKNEKTYPISSLQIQSEMNDWRDDNVKLSNNQKKILKKSQQRNRKMIADTLNNID